MRVLVPRMLIRWQLHCFRKPLCHPPSADCLHCLLCCETWGRPRRMRPACGTAALFRMACAMPRLPPWQQPDCKGAARFGDPSLGVFVLSCPVLSFATLTEHAFPTTVFLFKIPEISTESLDESYMSRWSLEVCKPIQYNISTVFSRTRL